MGLTRPRFMLIAGEASGEMLAAELVQALKTSAALSSLSVPAEFFGAGGPGMAAAGVELAVDLSQHAVFGLTDALRQYFTFKKIFDRLFRLALERQPDVIVLVDFSGFNRRFAAAIRKHLRTREDWFHNWRPKLVYFVSPQVWASRQGRAYQLARDVDLLLSIFPFEKSWYAARVPQLPVDFVGHPLIDRYSNEIYKLKTDVTVRGRLGESTSSSSEWANASLNETRITADASKRKLLRIALLPGSRRREVETHLPIMMEAVELVGRLRPLSARLVLPNAELAERAGELARATAGVSIQTGNLATALAEADLALACSGTVTLECAYFRVPTVVLYKTSWLTYAIGRRIVQVKFIAMPNILANAPLYPELIQTDATAENVAREALTLLDDPKRRSELAAQLSGVVESLGPPGASRRAASRILDLIFKWKFQGERVT